MTPSNACQAALANSEQGDENGTSTAINNYVSRSIAVGRNNYGAARRK